MKKIYRYLGIVTLYVGIGLIYVIFFLFGIVNVPIFIFLTIGSVAVLSTGTVYTIVQSRGSTVERKKDNKQYLKGKPIKKKSTDLLEDYYETMPSIDQYVNSEESYENMVNVDSFIFSIFNQEEINKIDLLGLSKMDKIYFIREMLYFDTDERTNLIETMLKNKENVDENIIYTPPVQTVGMGDTIRVYIRSLTEAGEKTKTINIDTTDLISAIKERVGILFDYKLDDFLLSSGGILLNDDNLINDYDIVDEDEIALIPLSKKSN